MEKLEYEKLLDGMVERWPSNWVARKKLEEFTGGAIIGRTAANKDSLGCGIPGKFLLCGQICYPAKSVIAWLKQNASSDWKNRRKGISS